MFFLNCCFCVFVCVFLLVLCVFGFVLSCCVDVDGGGVLSWCVVLCCVCMFCV